MGFFKKNIQNLTSVIKNEADGNLLISRHLNEDFNVGSTLIVAPNEEAVFIKNGILEQVFDSGTYNLTTENYPFISDIRNTFSGGKSSFSCNVFFVSKAHSMEIKWGTDSPIQLRDPVLEIATSIRARGAYKVKVENGAKLLLKLLGNNTEKFYQDELNNYFINEFQQHIKSCLTNAIISSNKEVLGISAEQNTLADNVMPELQKILFSYGLKLMAFSIAGIDIPQDDPNRQKLEDAFANRKVMNILGKDWSRQQSTEILHSLAENEGGIAGMGASIGMGLSVGNSMADMSKEVMKNIEEHKICPQCKNANLVNAKFCAQCGYKFGVKKFCTVCGHEIPDNAKFCENCGTKQEYCYDSTV